MATVTQQLYNNINRKVYIYEICCRKQGFEEDQKFDYTLELFNEINRIKGSLDYTKTQDNRWYGIESVVSIDEFIDCILICCKYNYMPNLIDVRSRTERRSPKTNSEGDKEKTHITIKDNIIAYEQRRNGTSATVLAKLLNIAWKNIRATTDNTISSIVLRQVIDNNFLDIIKNANTIKNAKFIVNSNLIGSDYFNFGNDSGVQDLYTLEIKAQPKRSIDKDRFINKIERFLVGEEQITKVTVNIIDEDDNPRIINSEEFSKQFNISVEKNNNGEVIDSDIFSKLKELI